MIGILDTGGNYGSLLSAFERTGYKAAVLSSGDDVDAVDRLVLPGVGRADVVMKRIGPYMAERIKAMTKPVFGICVGFHVMCQHSEEGDTPCMGIFPATVRKGRIHHGWSELRGVGWFFYTHGYHVAVNGIPTGIMARDNFLGVQFHCEKSGPTGIEFLRRWASGELES